jgi:hypothetical protein
MGPEIFFLIPLGFFASVVTVVIAVLRYKERTRSHDLGAGPMAGELMSRLDRMEQAIDAIAVEVERISEGQRFTTKLLSERGPSPQQLDQGPPARVRGA